MPVSKHRKNRRAYGARALPSATTLAEVVERGHRLAHTRAALFEGKSPRHVATAVFEGWTLLGYRTTDDRLAGLIETSVWEYDGLWLGFHVLHTSPEYPLDPMNFSIMEYRALMSDPFKTRGRDWDGLTGEERIHRLLTGLREDDTRGIGPVTAAGPLEFLDAVTAKHNLCLVGDPIGHLRDMTDIVLHDDIADPHGHLAAARTLAGLGGYEPLTA
jgi:hypothetical protein